MTTAQENPQDIASVVDRLAPTDPVAHHRYRELIRAGWTPNEADVVSRRDDIDWHFAADLVQVYGCPPIIAAQILL